MKTMRELMTGPHTSPDGKHWEPSIPYGLDPLRVRLRDAWAVFRGRALAVTQTPKEPR